MHVSPPFAGPVALDAYGRPRSNPFSLGLALGAVALTAVGAGAAYAGYRLKHRGRLQCAYDNHVIGVPLDYNGDWWEDRGRRRYYQARRDGHATGEGIALAILRTEISKGPNQAGGSLEVCMSQFPPHDGTHPRNVAFWQGLMESVLGEMGAEGMPMPGLSSEAAPDDQNEAASNQPTFTATYYTPPG